MKVIFSHGKESGPWGTKIQRLATIAEQHGCQVISVDYTDSTDPDQRVERLVALLRQQDEEFVLVGSSMGGYVALVAAAQVVARALFLMAPALYIPGYACHSYATDLNVEIVHGWDDAIIPHELSIRYARHANCPLHLIPGDHSLVSSLDTVAGLFAVFLRRHLDLGSCR